MIGRNVTVAGYRILLEPRKIEETIGVIIKPEVAKEAELRNTNEAKVLQVGPDAYRPSEFKEPWCKVGDKVLINPQSGFQYHVDNDTCLLIVNEEDILAVIGG